MRSATPADASPGSRRPARRGPAGAPTVPRSGATGHRQLLVDPPDAAALVAAGTSTGPYRWRSVVRLRAPLDVVTERVPPTAGQLEAAAGSGQECVLTTGSDSLDAIAAHLAWLGVPFTVESPPQLRAAVRSLGWRLVDGAGAGPGSTAVPPTVGP